MSDKLQFTAVRPYGLTETKKGMDQPRCHWQSTMYVDEIVFDPKHLGSFFPSTKNYGKAGLTWKIEGIVLFHRP